MLKVRYTGDEPLDHPSGRWMPGDERELDDIIAAGLVRERGLDMEIVKSGGQETKKAKPSSKRSAGGDT